MALEESDDKLKSVEQEGFQFQYDKRLENILKTTVIDYVESFWRTGLTISAAGSYC